MSTSRTQEWRKCDDIFLNCSPTESRWGGATRWWHFTDKACEYLLASALAPVLMLLFQTHLVYVVEH
ncbi:MAG: hypothetical protein ABSG36_10660 [Acidimicrobiales bacterium]|jgi:hypothetical protein